MLSEGRICSQKKRGGERGREGDASFGSDAPPVPTSKRLCSHFNATLELLNFKRNVDFSTRRGNASKLVL